MEHTCFNTILKLVLNYKEYIVLLPHKGSTSEEKRSPDERYSLLEIASSVASLW